MTGGSGDGGGGLTSHPVRMSGSEGEEESDGEALSSHPVKVGG